MLCSLSNVTLRDITTKALEYPAIDYSGSLLWCLIGIVQDRRVWALPAFLHNRLCGSDVPLHLVGSGSAQESGHGSTLESCRLSRRIARQDHVVHG